MAPLEPAADDTAVPSVERTKEMPAAAWSGRAQVPPPTGLRDSAPYTVAEPAPPGGRAWWTPVLLGMLALGLVGLIVLAAWLMGRETAPEPQITTSAPPIRSAAPTTAPRTSAPPTTTSPTPSPAPQLIAVPDLEGMTQEEAQDALEEAGLSYDIRYRPSAQDEGTVIETRPGAGEQVPPGTEILLVISSGPTTSSVPAPPTTGGADG